MNWVEVGCGVKDILLCVQVQHQGYTVTHGITGRELREPCFPQSKKILILYDIQVHVGQADKDG